MDNNITLEQVLQDLYDSEINVEISWFWDGGFDVALGNNYCGYKANDSVEKAQSLKL